MVVPYSAPTCDRCIPTPPSTMSSSVGKGSFSDTSAVCLDRTINGPQLARRDTQTSQDGSNGWVAGSDVRVSTEIDILQHGRIGTLHQYLFPLRKLLIGVLDRVDRHGLHSVRHGLVVLPAVLRHQFPIPHTRACRAAHSSRKRRSKCGQSAKSPTRSPFRLILLAIRRSDSLFRGANLVTAQLFFLHSVHFLVKVEYHVGAIANEDAAGGVNGAAGLERIELVQKGRDVDDDAIASAPSLANPPEPSASRKIFFIVRFSWLYQVRYLTMPPSESCALSHQKVRFV